MIFGVVACGRGLPYKCGIYKNNAWKRFFLIFSLALPLSKVVFTKKPYTLRILKYTIKWYISRTKRVAKMLDVKQIRAARALLDWSQGELARASNLSQQTIKMLENRHQTPRVETMGAIRTALEEAGIEFIPNCGVRQKRDIFRVLEGPDSYLHLLEDVFMTLKGSGEEVLFFYVDNEKLSQPIIDTDLRMRKNGIHFRFLIDEDKPYCLFPLAEYRCIPHRDFHNNTIIIYADKVGVMIDGHMMCHLTRNLSYANTMRRIFERLWKTHPAPKRTLSKVTYE